MFFHRMIPPSASEPGMSGRSTKRGIVTSCAEFVDACTRPITGGKRNSNSVRGPLILSDICWPAPAIVGVGPSPKISESVSEESSSSTLSGTYESEWSVTTIFIPVSVSLAAMSMNVCARMRADVRLFPAGSAIGRMLTDPCELLGRLYRSDGSSAWP